MSMLVFMVFGSVLEGLPAIVLFGSLLFPIANTLGINTVYFAMVTILSMGLGLFAPPVGDWVLYRLRHWPGQAGGGRAAAAAVSGCAGRRHHRHRGRAVDFHGVYLTGFWEE